MLCTAVPREAKVGATAGGGMWHHDDSFGISSLVPGKKLLDETKNTINTTTVPVGRSDPYRRAH